MIQPEANYGRFRRLFTKKRHSQPQVFALPEESPEDIIERDRVRRVQLAARGRLRILRELKKLDDEPSRRFENWLPAISLFVIVLVIVFSLLELIDRVFMFDPFPSDSMDVLRDVLCDSDGCTVRAYFDLEPPSMIRLGTMISTGLLAFIVCIRHVVGIDCKTLTISILGASSLSVCYISWRSNIYLTERIFL